MLPRRSSDLRDHRYALSLFKEEPSTLLRVVVFCVLAICLMVADVRFKLSPFIRQGVAAAIYPVEWVAMQPVHWWNSAQSYFDGLQKARVDEDAARVSLVQQTLRAALVESLSLENTRLRALLSLSERPEINGRAAEVLYELPDPYSQRLMVDRGLAQGIQNGAPVLDDLGVIGQVSRVLPLTSEVTLLTNNGFSVAVTNARTGVFGVAYGDADAPVSSAGGGLELRFLPLNADVEQGDLLITSGNDGVYPVGLPVARVLSVERNPSDMFARIWCEPVARIHNTRYVMLVQVSQNPSSSDSAAAAEDALPTTENNP